MPALDAVFPLIEMRDFGNMTTKFWEIYENDLLAFR